MRKLAAVLLGISLFLITQNAFAFIGVGSFGETGWQTFSHTFDENWTGQAGFLVSNYDDQNLDSVLLVDNLSPGPAGNTGFESGLTGYTLVDSSNVAIVNSYNSYNGTTYSSYEGSFMARLLAEGTSTTNYGGTDGAILWITDPKTFTTGQTFSFNWNFLAMDYYPFMDFAMFLHTEPQGIIEGETLAKIVPEPATLSLLGLGLLGLMGLRKKKIT